MNAKIIILGSELRGLWLASELKKIGFTVTWVDVETEILDRPWQMGSEDKIKQLPETAQKFLKDYYNYVEQQGLQIITEQGPFEFNKENLKRGIDVFFPKSKSEILGYVEALKDGKQSLVAALGSKISKLSRSERWVLNWLGTLQKNHDVKLDNWIKDITLKSFSGLNTYFFLNSKILNPDKSAFDDVKAQGVSVLMKPKLVDIGVDGAKITGIESDVTKGFQACDELVLACPTSTLLKVLPHLDEKLKNLKQNVVEPQFVWMKYNYKMKLNSKPEGVFKFSSFIVDPMMPLAGSQLGIMRWLENGKSDLLTVWCKLPIEETKKQSTLKESQTAIFNHLSKLIISFEENFLEELPFNFNLKVDEYSFVYSQGEEILSGQHKKNLWLAGLETDLEGDLVSSLETEKRTLDLLLKRYEKELKRDRALHTPRNGPTVGA
jgi:hypothetical protein